MYKFLAVGAAAFLASALPSICAAQAVPGSPAPSVQAAPALERPSVPVFSQTDPRWASLRFRGNRMATKGCLVTVYAMAGGMPPDEMLAMLVSHGLIDRNGLVKTREVGAVLPLQFVERMTMFGRDPASAVAERLALGMVVMLELNHSARGGRGRHFVLVTKAEDGDITVADPAGGREASLLDLYGKLGVKSAIVYQRTQ